MIDPQEKKETIRELLLSAAIKEIAEFKARLTEVESKVLEISNNSKMESY